MTQARPITEQGRATALQALAARRKASKSAPRVDNASLYAGQPMYYYCKSCGALADVLPECHINRPKQLCNECQAMQDLGWLV